jgi:hypothetical protein
LTEAESQTVLNTLKEHDFQDAFKKWQECWEWCKHTEGDYFKGDGGQQVQSQFLTIWQHQSRKLWMTLCTIKYSTEMYEGASGSIMVKALLPLHRPKRRSNRAE